MPQLDTSFERPAAVHAPQAVSALSTAPVTVAIRKEEHVQRGGGEVQSGGK